MPKVTIILTSYNHENYLRESIDSILCQTLADFELIIIDDHSTDGSPAIIRSYQDPRIRSVFHEKNENSSRAFLPFIDASTAPYIAIAHSDDAWEPAKLEKQVTFLDSHQEIVACFTQVQLIDESGSVYLPPEGNYYRTAFQTENRSRYQWLRYFFDHFNCLCHPSVMMRREMYRKYDLLESPGIFQLPDLMQWVSLCLHEEIYIYPEKLTRFRLHTKAGQEENTSGDRLDAKLRVFSELMPILRKYRQLSKPSDFLKVFPEATSLVKDGEIHLPFALARQLLHHGGPAYDLIGLQLLFELINSPHDAAEIERLYHYDRHRFYEDTGKCDPFSLKSSLLFLDTELFWNDGTGFQQQKSQKKQAYIRQDGHFSVSYTIQASSPIQDLRFDPCGGPIILTINQFTVNGQPCPWQPLNGAQTGDRIIFPNADPQIVVHLPAPSLSLTITVFGETSANDMGLPLTLRLLSQIRQQKAALQGETERLAHRLQEKDATLTAITSTRGYRLLEFLRTLRRKLSRR